MGLIARLVEIKNRILKVDLNSNNIVSTWHFQPAGDDAPPLITDKAFVSETKGADAFASLGFYDTKNSGVAEKGEKRIFSRGSDGLKIAEIYLKKDGSINISGGSGTIHIKTSGEIELSNGSGNIKLTPGGKLEINGADFLSHTHSGVTSGTEDTGGVVII